jgi:hypothetical protein
VGGGGAVPGQLRGATDPKVDLRTVTEPGAEPQLASTRVNGQVQLTLTGKQGSSYDIQTSTDLANWTSTLNFTVTVTNPDGTLTFPAPGTTSDAQRFYRAALQ